LGTTTFYEQGLICLFAYHILIKTKNKKTKKTNMSKQIRKKNEAKQSKECMKMTCEIKKCTRTPTVSNAYSSTCHVPLPKIKKINMFAM
jgi:hypothetical protein